MTGICYCLRADSFVQVDSGQRRGGGLWGSGSCRAYPVSGRFVDKLISVCFVLQDLVVSFLVYLSEPPTCSTPPPNRHPLKPSLARRYRSGPQPSVARQVERGGLSAWGCLWEPKLQPPPPLGCPLYEICWGLRKADLYVPPQKVCHTGAVIVGPSGEFMVVSLCFKWVFGGCK